MATDELSGSGTHADDLLAELRGEGELDSVGRFTLDRAQARAKLQKFQLADARRYVLELVQAAVLRGASTIAFDIDADDMRMRFDGRVFTAAELDELWGSIFAEGDTADLRGLRQLGLGLNAALGTEPKRIVVRSGATQVLLQPGKEDAFSSISSAIAETTIHVKQRVKLVLVVEFLRNLTGQLSEEVYLRERCGYTELAITLDGKPIGFGLRQTDMLVSAPLSGDDFRGVIGLAASEAPAELRLVKDGVWIDTHRLDQCGPGLVAVVAGERLRKDVSLAKIVADDALAQILGQVRIARWALFTALVERVQAGALASEPAMKRVRSEVLEFLKGRLLRSRPEVAVIAKALVFAEARTLGAATPRQVNLLELANTVPSVASERDVFELRFAYLSYPLVVAEGLPIPVLGDAEANALARMFSCRTKRVDDELERASQRERARRAWLARPMNPTLPEFRRYLVRAPLEAAGMRGELGIRVEAQGASPPADGTLWLLREGCLLGKLELAWGIAALDVVVEAGFAPTNDYQGVVPDRELARVCAAVLAGLAVPLAGLIEHAQDERLAASVRALVKPWLTLLLDAEEREQLFACQLGIADAELAASDHTAMLPSGAQLRSDVEPWSRLFAAPLFEDFDGARRSLRELGERFATQGAIDELERSVAPVPGLGSGVAWLGPSDRKILRGSFGESALRSWLPQLAAKQREQAFWAKPVEDLEARFGAVRSALGIAGVDADLWTRRVEGEGIAGVITLGYGVALGDDSIAPKLLRGGTIELIHQGRSLTQREFDLGVGPIFGVVRADSLRVAASWDDVEDDLALAALSATLREAAWELLAGLIRRFGELYKARQWLTPLVLHRLGSPDGDQVGLRLPELARLPLLATLDGGTLSLVELDAIVREHGQIEWVTTNTPGANLRNPAILREPPLVLAGLKKLLGPEKLIEGADRVRRHGLSARLEALPKVERAELDPSSVWFAVSLGGQPNIEGEIGLSRERSAGGLALELCTLGRRIEVVMQGDLPVALEAIIADPELPLLADGSVDTRSKRFGQHLRRCRRAMAGLIVTMCKRFEALAPADRARVRVQLLAYAQTESVAGPGRREARENAWEAVRALPLIVDVWGQRHSLATIEARTKRRGSVDVVGKPVELDIPGGSLDRLILVVDEPARACLSTMTRLVDIDTRWERELEALRELAGAPEFVRPDLRKHAWIDRKGAVAGGLEAELWIPRTPSEADVLVFVRGRKQVAKLGLIPGLPCAGVVSGEGIVLGPSGVMLDTKQRVSLVKQICGLYEALAKQVQSGGNRMSASEREAALVWLVGVLPAIERDDEPVLAGIGKPLTRLRESLGAIISPALRRSLERTRAAKVEPTPVEPTPVEPTPPIRPAARVEPAPVESAPAPPIEVFDSAAVLLTLLRGELEWARARHGVLLDRLGLDRFRLAEGGSGIAVFDRGVVLQRQHPVVARLLAQLDQRNQSREVDPIDLAFLVSGVFTLMNAVAEEIDEGDERAFVGHMAQSLALALRP